MQTLHAAPSRKLSAAQERAIKKAESRGSSTAAPATIADGRDQERGDPDPAPPHAHAEGADGAIRGHSADKVGRGTEDQRQSGQQSQLH